MQADRYFIVEGVRRAIAAREVGLSTLRATLEVPGRPDLDFNAPLSSLYAGRAATPRTDVRYLRPFYGLQDPAERAKAPRIVVVPLANAPAGVRVPLHSVRLTA